MSAIRQTQHMESLIRKGETRRHGKCLILHDTTKKGVKALRGPDGINFSIMTLSEPLWSEHPQLNISVFQTALPCTKTHV